MGAERWLRFKTLEVADHAREYLSTLGPDIQVRDEGCFLDWTESRKLEVGYSFGGDLDDVVAIFVCREIARRFKVHSIGSDHVGWYLNKDWQLNDPKAPKARYGPYKSWTTWLLDYKPEWYVIVNRGAEVGEVQRIEKSVEAMFAALDQSTGRTTG